MNDLLVHLGDGKVVSLKHGLEQEQYQNVDYTKLGSPEYGKVRGYPENVEHGSILALVSDPPQSADDDPPSLNNDSNSNIDNNNDGNDDADDDTPDIDNSGNDTGGQTEETGTAATGATTNNDTGTEEAPEVLSQE